MREYCDIEDVHMVVREKCALACSAPCEPATTMLATQVRSTRPGL